MVRKAKPSQPVKTPREPVQAETNGVQPFAEGDIDFNAWLRVQRHGGQLPLGVSPEEKRQALEALADSHGVGLVQDPRAMVADFWPKHETAADMVEAIRALRRQGG